MPLHHHYDAIVVGTGGIGSAALYQLAKRGRRVLGLDRFPAAHDRGSSHGQTRLIRRAYFEHPDYVPLLLRAYELWRELEQTVGRTLLVESGLVIGGPPASEVLKGVRTSAAIHNLLIEEMSPQSATHRWAGLRLPAEWDAIYEPQAGYLFVEECVRAHIEAAARAGAEIRYGVSVLHWQTDRNGGAGMMAGRGVTLQTDRDTFTCDRLVLCPGPWAEGLLQLPSLKLTVLRKSLFWYATRTAAQSPRASYAAGRFPCFAFDAPEGFFYGFPQLDDRGIKIAEHTGGQPVADPLSLDSSLNTAEQQRVEQMLARHLPGISSSCTDHAACMYTMSQDSHFAVGRHPAYPAVALAAGFSGHGFKFASVIGEILAELATQCLDTAPAAIKFLSPDRFESAGVS